MSEMIERVARAIEWAGYDWSEVDANSWHEAPFEVYARAAIEAMMEPTDEVIKALKYYGMLDGDADETWKMAIKAALAEAK